MSNQKNDNKRGTVRYSSKTMSKLSPFRIDLKKGLSYILVGGIMFGGGYLFGVNSRSDDKMSEELHANELSSTVDNSPAPLSPTKNNFKTDNTYAPGDEINIADCDFSEMCVVLDAADDTDALYGELLESQELLRSYGIDCVVTSYYDSAIDEIERIKTETGKTVFVASVQTNQNKTDQHLIATNYYNNADARGETAIEEGDKNSSDAFAMAVQSSMSHSALNKGLASDTTDYDRRPSQLEQDISAKKLKRVKAITIRTSEITPLRSGELGDSLLKALARASTLNNDLTYLVLPSSWSGYAVPGTIFDKYGYENVPYGKKFSTYTAVLARETPAQLTNQVKINYGNPVDIAYQEITSGAKTH